MRPTPLIAAIALLAAGASVHAASTGFQLLGSGVLATSVSADGSIVGGDNNITGHYFSWTSAGGLSDIGGLAPGKVQAPNIGAAGGELRMNDAGTRFSGTIASPTGGYVAGYYTPATNSWTALPSLGGVAGSLPTANVSASFAMNSDGNLIAGYGYAAGTGSGRLRGAVWNVSAGTATNMGSLGTPGLNDLGSRIAGISDDGSLAAGWDGANQYASVWANGTQTNITDTYGRIGQALGVSDNGQWAFGQDAHGAAWRWSAATGVQNLGFLPGSAAGLIGFATASNYDGSVILGFQRAGGLSPTSGQSFIWTAAGGMQDFDTFLHSQGVDLGNTFNFAIPFSISADGKTIVGVGQTVGEAGYDPQGFVVTLPTSLNVSAVPEPSTYAMFLAGAGLMGLVARRRRQAD